MESGIGRPGVEGGRGEGQRCSPLPIDSPSDAIEVINVISLASRGRISALWLYENWGHVFCLVSLSIL